MYKFSAIFAFITIFMSVPAHGSEPALLTGKTLKSHFSGQTMLGEYKSKTPRSDGYDYREVHNTDGTVEYREGQFRVTGIWYMKGNKEICYVYDEPSGKTRPMCGVYVKVDGCVYGYDISDLNKKDLPYNLDHWDARHVAKGSGQTCAEPVS